MVSPGVSPKIIKVSKYKIIGLFVCTISPVSANILRSFLSFKSQKDTTCHLISQQQQEYPFYYTIYKSQPWHMYQYAFADKSFLRLLWFPQNKYLDLQDNPEIKFAFTSNSIRPRLG